MIHSVNQSDHPKYLDVLLFAPYVASALVYWSICQAVRTPKSAIMVGLQHSQASSFATASGFDVSHVLSKAMLLELGLDVLKSDNIHTYEPLVLSCHSSNLLLKTKPVAGLCDIGGPGQFIEQSSADDYFGGLRKLDWLHIACNDIDDVLRGSTELVKRDRPIISIECAISNEKLPSIFAFAAECNFGVFDANFTEIEHISTLETCKLPILLVPMDTKILQSLRSASQLYTELKAPCSQLSPQDIAAKYCHTLLQYSSPVDDLMYSFFSSQKKPLTLSKIFSRGFYERSFYERAIDDKPKLIWTSNSRESKLILPVDLSSIVRVNIKFHEFPQALNKLFVVIFANGIIKLKRDILVEEELEILIDTANKSYVELLFCVPEVFSVDGKQIAFSLTDVSINYSGSENL